MKLYQKITWKFLQLTAGNYYKKALNLECINHNEEPDGPFILLGNHAHHMDAFFIATFLKKPLHYLGSDEIATTTQQVLAELTGMLYTKKGIIDPKAVRQLLKAVKEGDAIGIFPEGDGCWDGETDKLYENIVRLVKKLKLPIRLAVLRGAYLTRPRWAKAMRKGKVIVEFKTMSADEIQKMSEEELLKIIAEYLYNNDVKNVESLDINFKGKHVADGIQYLLWKCPVCYSHDSIGGKGDSIVCKTCHTEWKLDANMKVTEDYMGIHDLKDWSDWQRKQVSNIISFNENNELTTSKHVTFEIFSHETKRFNIVTKHFKKYGDGTLTLYKDTLNFVPDDKNIDPFEVKVEDIINYVDCVNEHFLLYTNNETYKISFNQKNASRYVYFLRELHEYLEKQKQEAELEKKHMSADVQPRAVVN